MVSDGFYVRKLSVFYGYILSFFCSTLFFVARLSLPLKVIIKYLGGTLGYPTFSRLVEER